MSLNRQGEKKIKIRLMEEYGLWTEKYLWGGGGGGGRRNVGVYFPEGCEDLTLQVTINGQV